MFRSQYYFDCNAVGAAAAEFAKTIPISGDGTDVWVFDVDETMLSNLIFFASSGAQFGGDGDKGSSAIAYKSKKRRELVKQGYRIVGNVGDQWSDLIGENVGNRTFKVPDPMYYIG